MATLFLPSSFVPLSSGKLFVCQCQPWNPLQYPPRKYFSFTICASKLDKSSRSSRKVKSDEELYNDIREFLSTVGLAKNHVPSMKELSVHGRNDLAHIVRRRGYKYIRQLLESSARTDFDGFTAEKCLAGQDQKVKNKVEDASLSVEVPRETESYPLNSQNEDVNNIVEESSSNLSLEEMVSPDINGQHEKGSNITETISSSVDAPIVENYSSNSNFNSSVNFEHGYPTTESSAFTSLEEKAAKFIQNGDLDMIDDNDYDILNGSDAKESEGVIDREDAIKSRIGGAEHTNICNESIRGAMNLKGSALTKPITPSAIVNHPLRDEHSATEVLRGVDFDGNLNVEASKRENQIEVNHLKFMLHQKEVELSRLNKLIEKEKFALSVLQTKVETEISKAQNLISEKDAELFAAKEGLSGVEEVQIQYSGDGEIVEVAGSFNGWHHRIKMDPQPTSSIIEPVESRKSRCWATVLWLYPGIYEIKFIVDGQWKIDPQQESVTTGGICNNILRVNR